MGMKRSLFFLFGCVSGLVLASTAFFICYVTDFTDNTEYTKSSGLQNVLSNDIQRKKATLIIVISSPMQLDNTFKATINSWGQMTTDWKIAIGGISPNSSRLKKYGHQGRNYILEANYCEDFWPYSNISAKQLYCLLSAIHRTSSTDYDWIVIISDKTYLAINALNNLLGKLDPNVSQYIGRPSRVCKSNGLTKTCLSYCSMQHGLILSQPVLTEVTTQLSMCLCDTNLIDKTILIQTHGDVLLGFCLKTNLLLKCSDSLLEYQENVSALFLDYSSHSWHHGNVVSLSSINNCTVMQEVHVHITSLDMLAHTRQANKYAILAHDACQKLPDVNSCNLAHNPMDISLRVSTFFSRNTETKLLKWETVKGNTIYSSDRLEPSRKLSDGEKMMLNHMVHKSLEYLGDYTSSLTLEYVPLAYFRHNSNYLVECIVDLELRDIEEKVLWRSYLYSLPGITDVKAFQMNKLLDVMIEFIIPVNQDKRRLISFLKNYEDLCLVNEENCSLNLIAGENIIYYTKELIRTIVTKYSKAKVKVIEDHGKFSPGKAIDIGIKAVNSHSIVLSGNVQMIIKQEFLQHCRMNAIEGKQFYYPDFFQFYNSKYVNTFKRKFSETLSRRNGYWTSQSHTFCLYKTDYVTAAETGHFTGFRRDDNLVQSLINHGLEMIRAPDPSLMRDYEDIKCHDTMPEDKLSNCISFREQSLADRTELAEYIFYKEDKCSIRHWDLRTHK